ncbi:integrase, catalytic region, zinc finger, CCHC-type containing protein, partial [Tanacetum coccineum]
VASSSSVSRLESKDTNSKKRILLNTKSKITSKDVKKSKIKTVNAVHDGSNLVCVSYGKDVFMISHDKCVARYALSSNSRVKRALFTSPVAAKSSKLGDTLVVSKSRFSVATPPKETNKVIQLVLWIVDSGCSKHMIGNLKLLRNFIEKFIGTVHFGNDNFVAITRYGDYVQGNLTICHVYYVESIGHNLFSVRQFYDGDLEVAFRSNTCYVQNLEGEYLLTGSHDSNLYTILISKMAASSLVFLMSKATSIKSWLWHRQFSHLNFGKSKKATFPSKLIPRTNSKFELLHMDLCGPMRVETVTRRQYIMVQVLKVRSDNGTEFKNDKLRSYYDKLGIMHQTSIARTPQQNVVVEHRNCNNPLFQMKPKADIGIIVGYSESSRGFGIYNRRTRKIIKTIHVKFNELTTMAFECNNSGPEVNCSNFQDSSEDVNAIQTQQDLDNLFGPLYEEYYTPRTPEVSDNSAAKTLNNEDTPSSSSIIVEDNDVPHIVTSSEEPIAQEPSTPVLNTHSDEQIQKDVAQLNGNTFMNLFGTPEYEEDESSSNYQNSSNMHEFYQQHRFTDRWTKNHQINK